MQIGTRAEATVVIIAIIIARMPKDKITMGITKITAITISEVIITGVGTTTNRIGITIIIPMVIITLVAVTITGMVITKAKAGVTITIIITEITIIAGITAIE